MGQWLLAARTYLILTGFTDASSIWWGGIIRGPSGVFHMRGDFLKDKMDLYINVKEAVALENSQHFFVRKVGNT